MTAFYGVLFPRKLILYSVAWIKMLTVFLVNEFLFNSISDFQPVQTVACYYLGLVATKPVFEVSDKARLKAVPPATVTC